MQERRNSSALAMELRLSCINSSTCIPIVYVLFAGQALTELSREKTTGKQVEIHTTHFLKTLESVENGLSKHISYLTQVSTSKWAGFKKKILHFGKQHFKINFL